MKAEEVLLRREDVQEAFANSNIDYHAILNYRDRIVAKAQLKNVVDFLEDANKRCKYKGISTLNIDREDWQELQRLVE